MESCATPASVPVSLTPAGAAGEDRTPARAGLIAAAPMRQTLGLVTLAWFFGSVWWTTTSGEPLTVFAQGLGASNFDFGLLAALPFIASLASLAGSLLSEWTGHKKLIFLASLYVQRLMWVVIAIAPLWMIGQGGRRASPSALHLFLVLAFLSYAAGAVGGPAWLSWMAELVPRRINGKYFSGRRQWGILSGIPAAILAGWILDRCGAGDAPLLLRCCGLLFLASAICGLADIHLFQYVPASRAAPQAGRQLLHGLRKPLADARFLNFSGFVAMLTFAVSFFGQFATLYLLERVRMSNLGTQMVLVVAPMVAQLLVLGAWGAAADRMGKRPLLVLSSIGLVPVALAWCLVTPGAVWLAYLLSGLGAALWTGIEVANMNLVLEASGGAPGRRCGGCSYAAVNSVIINIAGCAGGLVAGGVAQLLSNWHWQPLASFKTFSFYDVLFVASAILRLASAVVFIPLLHEPAARSSAQVLRFMIAAVFAPPLRSIARITRPAPRGREPVRFELRIEPDPLQRAA